MPANYTKWMNFWENLTPLDSSHLELFLEIFWKFFIFWIQIWILNLGRFGTDPNQNRTEPVRPVTGQTRPVPTGKVNPDHDSQHFRPSDPQPFTDQKFGYLTRNLEAETRWKKSAAKVLLPWISQTDKGTPWRNGGDERIWRTACKHAALHRYNLLYLDVTWASDLRAFFSESDLPTGN